MEPDAAHANDILYKYLKSKGKCDCSYSDGVFEYNVGTSISLQTLKCVLDLIASDGHTHDMVVLGPHCNELVLQTRNRYEEDDSREPSKKRKRTNTTYNVEIDEISVSMETKRQIKTVCASFDRQLAVHGELLLQSIKITLRDVPNIWLSIRTNPGSRVNLEDLKQCVGPFWTDGMVSVNSEQYKEIQAPLSTEGKVAEGFGIGSMCILLLIKSSSNSQ